jgi:hypothetical protein
MKRRERVTFRDVQSRGSDVLANGAGLEHERATRISSSYDVRAGRVRFDRYDTSPEVEEDGGPLPDVRTNIEDQIAGTDELAVEASLDAFVARDITIEALTVGASRKSKQAESRSG